MLWKRVATSILLAVYRTALCTGKDTLVTLAANGKTVGYDSKGGAGTSMKGQGLRAAWFATCASTVVDAADRVWRECVVQKALQGQQPQQQDVSGASAEDASVGWSFESAAQFSALALLPTCFSSLALGCPLPFHYGFTAKHEGDSTSQQTAQQTTLPDALLIRRHILGLVGVAIRLPSPAPPSLRPLAAQVAGTSQLQSAEREHMMELVVQALCSQLPPLQQGQQVHVHQVPVQWLLLQWVIARPVQHLVTCTECTTAAAPATATVRSTGSGRGSSSGNTPQDLALNALQLAKRILLHPAVHSLEALARLLPPLMSATCTLAGLDSMQVGLVVWSSPFCPVDLLLFAL
jgi:hypothetical protein